MSTTWSLEQKIVLENQKYQDEMCKYLRDQSNYDKTALVRYTTITVVHMVLPSSIEKCSSSILISGILLETYLDIYSAQRMLSMDSLINL